MASQMKYFFLTGIKTELFKSKKIFYEKVFFPGFYSDFRHDFLSFSRKTRSWKRSYKNRGKASNGF